MEFAGNRTRRGEQKRADYLQRYTRDYPIAVVEAKPEGDPFGKGMQQAKDYAEILGLKFAYANNGKEIQEMAGHLDRASSASALLHLPSVSQPSK